jgi:hypothetical protein
MVEPTLVERANEGTKDRATAWKESSGSLAADKSDTIFAPF